MKSVYLFFGVLVLAGARLFGGGDDEFGDLGDTGDEIQKQVARPAPTCLSDIVKVLNLQAQIDTFIKQFGDFSDLVETQVFPKICFTDGQVTIKDNVVTITPSKTQAAKLDDCARIFVQNNKKSFSAGIRYKTIAPIKPYLNKLPYVPQLFNLVDFSNPIVAFANANDKGPLLGVANLLTGLTLAADLTVKPGNFLNDVLSEINLTNLQLKCTVPPGITSVKQVKIEMVPLQEPAQGVCLLKALIPVLTQLGVQSNFQPLFAVLQLLCFGTDIGITIDPTTGAMIFYIQGPLKNTPAVGAVKARARTDSDQASPGKYIITAGMKLATAQNVQYTKISSLVPQLKYLDDVVVIADPVICVSNDKGPKTLSAGAAYTIGLFDINAETKQMDSALPGALNVGYGVTVSATISSGSLFEQLKAIKPLSDILDLLRLQVQITAKNAINVQIVRADGKPITLNLADFLGVDQLQAVPLIGDVSKSSLSTPAIAIVQDSQTGLQLVVSGAISVANIPMRAELRIVKGSSGPQYAVGIFQNGSLTLDKIDNSLAGVAAQLGRLSNTAVVLSSADYPVGLWDVPQIKKGVNILGDYTASGFASDVSSEVGLNQMRARIFLSKDSGGKVKPVVTLIPLQKPAQGICLLKALGPVLKQVGLQSAAQPLAQLLALLCFGTDIGMTLDPETGGMIFYIQGPLKNTAADGAVKARARTANDQASPGKYIITAGMKLAGAQKISYNKISTFVPQLAYLDTIVGIADPVICVSNDKGPKTQPVGTRFVTSLFDIDSETKQIESSLSGALSVGYGVTVSATINSGPLFSTLQTIQPFKEIINNVRVQVRIGAKNDISTHIVRADGQPFVFKLTDLPGLEQLQVQKSPLLGDATDVSVNVVDVRVEKTPKTLELVIDGTLVVVGQSAPVQVRMVVDGTDKMCVAGIFLGGTFTLGEIYKGFSSVSELGALGNLTVVLSNIDFAVPINFTNPVSSINNIKMGINIVSDLNATKAFADAASILFGYTKLNAIVSFTRDKSGIIKPRLTMYSPQQEQPLCLSALQSLVSESKPAIDLVKKIVGSDVCVDRRTLTVIPVFDGADLVYQGKINNEWPVSLVVNVDKAGVVKSFGIKIETKGTFDLGMFDSRLKGQVTLIDPAFMIATKAMNQAGIDVVRAGCSVDAVVSFGGFMSDVLHLFKLSQFLNDVIAEISIPFNTSNLAGYEVMLAKPLASPEKPMGDMLQINGFDVKFKGGVPPLFGLDLDGMFMAPGTSSAFNIKLGASISGPTFTLSGASKCTQEPCPVIDFGSVFPVKIHATPETPLSALVHVTGGQVTGFGGSGEIDLLNKKSKAAFDINLADASKCGIKCRFDKLCLSDIATLYTTFFGNVTGFDVSTKINQLPQLFCITDADFSAAKKSVTVAGFSIDPGLTCVGNFDSAVLPVHGTVNIRVIPPSLANLITKTMEIGLQGTITFAPIDLDGLIKITAVGSSNGPIVQVNATPSKQNIRATANVTIVDPSVLSQTADVTFDTDGLTVVATRKIFGLEAQLNARALFKDLPHTGLSFAITDNLTSEIQGHLTEAIAEVKDQAKKQFVQTASDTTKGIRNAIEQIITHVPSSVRGLPGAQGVMSNLTSLPAKADTLAQTAITQASARIDATLNMSKLSVDQIILTANVQDFKKGLFVGTIEYTLFGSKESVKFAPVTITDRGALVSVVSHAIVAKFKKPDLSDVENGLKKSLSDLLTQAKNLLHELLNYLKDNLMNLPLAAVNTVLDFMGNIKNLPGALGDVGSIDLGIGSLADLVGKLTGSLQGVMHDITSQASKLIESGPLGSIADDIGL